MSGLSHAPLLAGRTQETRSSGQEQIKGLLLELVGGLPHSLIASLCRCLSEGWELVKLSVSHVGVPKHTHGVFAEFNHHLVWMGRCFFELECAPPSPLKGWLISAFWTMQLGTRGDVNLG